MNKNYRNLEQLSAIPLIISLKKENKSWMQIFKLLKISKIIAKLLTQLCIILNCQPKRMKFRVLQKSMNKSTKNQLD